MSNHLELNGRGTPNLIRIRNVNGGHVKTTFVESWSLAELLDDLHHYSLGQPVTKRQRNTSGGERERKDVTSCFKLSLRESLVILLKRTGFYGRECLFTCVFCTKHTVKPALLKTLDSSF